MDKRQQKTLKKINNFFERVKMSKVFKVSDEVLSGPCLFKTIIGGFTKGVKFKCAKNITVDLGLDGEDFIRCTRTVIIKYTYPKQLVK